MPERTVRFLLALVLAWVGLTTQVQAAPAAPFAGGQVEGAVAAGDPLQCAASDAATAHEPGELPAQAQTEGGTDVPDLVHQRAAVTVVAAAVRPRPHPMTAWLTAALDGWRRPPRGLDTPA